MDINWTQVIAQMFGTAMIVPVSTVVTFLVMRYFPKFWEKNVEKSVVNFFYIIKSNGKNGNGKNGRIENEVGKDEKGN